MNYLYEYNLKESDFSSETCNLEYLKRYLNPEKECESGILKKYPLSLFGKATDTFKISGIKTLLDTFDLIDAERKDYTTDYSNVEFCGINENKQIHLFFPNYNLDNSTDGTNAYSIYDAYNTFLSQFKITNYINYCFDMKYEDIISSNLKELLKRNSKQTKQYRLLWDKQNNAWGIRTITSERYKNFDNNVVMYLAFLMIQKYANDNKTQFIIREAYLTDSFMHIFIEQEAPITINSVGQAYLGFSISNGEIRNYKCRIELRYRIVGDRNECITAIYNNPIVEFNHNSTTSTMKKSIENFQNIDKQKKNLITFLYGMREIKELTPDVTYSLLSDLVQTMDPCNEISTKTKNGFKEYQKKNIENTAISIFQLFDKLETISTDINEKTFIERIFHNVINDTIQRVQARKRGRESGNK